MVGGLVVALIVTVMVRKRRKKAKARAAAHIVPIEKAPVVDQVPAKATQPSRPDDADPEFEPA